MKVPFVDLTRIHLPIRNEIATVLDSILNVGNFILGDHVKKFEDAFAAYIGTNFCVGCANGTDAIELALEGLGIGNGDEVLLPNHTWISTASAIVKQGAKPILVDTLYKEYTINPALIEKAITPKTKAIIVVHLFGSPCRMNEILTVAKKYNLLVIEDCAQAHGAMYEGKKVGSFGDVGCFSFYPSKNLGAIGDGGAITTNHLELSAKLRMLLNCGQSSKNKIEVIGRNSRLDAIQAAVLSIKLKQLDDWNEQRRNAASYYCKLLKSESSIELPVETDKEKHVYHLFVIKSEAREKLISAFDNAEIGYGIHYPFMLNNFFPTTLSLSFSESYCSKIVSLPLFVGIKKEEIERVVEIVCSKHL
jgi:dTDP-4-amino-4,6-dideoxygalactose transaminase